MSTSATRVLSRGDPIIILGTGRARNLIEPVHFAVRYKLDSSSTASNTNWVGAHEGASAVSVPAAIAMVISTSKYNVNEKVVTNAEDTPWVGTVSKWVTVMDDVPVRKCMWEESWPENNTGGSYYFLVKGGPVCGGKKGQTKTNIWW
jgi:hypothetical protein